MLLSQTSQVKPWGFSAGLVPERRWPLCRSQLHRPDAGSHRTNLTSLVSNHDQDANFLCGAYD